MTLNFLDDRELGQYLEDGYVVLDPHELDDAFHDRMFHAACVTYGMGQGAASQGAPPHIRVIADNLRQRIPDVGVLLNNPTIRGAITSVLGDDWQIYPHDFIHESSAADQYFHQDGNLPWNDRGHYRTHRPEWAMLFYYPQETDLSSGPTEVLPGTQYWTSDYELPDDKWHRGDPMARGLRPPDNQTATLTERDAFIQSVADAWEIPDLKRRMLMVPRGGAILASYDLVHRGTRKHIEHDTRRFMYKFYLYRATTPSQRSPTSDDSGVPETRDIRLMPIVERNLSWLRGSLPQATAKPSNGSIESLLEAKNDAARMQVAYELGLAANHDEDLRSKLVALIAHDRESLRRAAGYGCGQLVDFNSESLSPFMCDTRAPVRRACILALRESECSDPNAIEWLLDRVENDPDELVRSNAAYALGLLLRANRDLHRFNHRLIARLDHAIEPDNTTNGGMSRSTVRENIALALTMTQLTSTEIAEVVTYAINEHDRYAKSLLFIAVQRSAKALTEPWVTQLVEYLTEHRYVA